MIRNDNEYKQLKAELEGSGELLQKERLELENEGFTQAEVARGTQPAETFVSQRRAELRLYERLKDGQMQAVEELPTQGLQLIALRIALGVPQRELAERLGVHESTVLRDEKNEYHGVTTTRVDRILEVLGVTMERHYIAEERETAS